VNAMHLRAQVVKRAAGSYRASGRSAYYFARFKLRYDPFYSLLLQQQLVPAGARILDLGCAQGLLAAWLVAARQCYSQGLWDDTCPVPVPIESYRGVDRNQAEIRRARLALGNSAEFIVGDILAEHISEANLIVLLDVLHYLEYGAQVKLLRLIRDALTMEGSLLIRVGDGASRTRAYISRWVDRLVVRLRSGNPAVVYCRSLTEWFQVLGEAGYAVQEIARQSSLGYANSLLRATPTRT